MADYTLLNPWALGDTAVLSAVVRDIALTYPGKYRIAVRGHYTTFWRNNPYVTPFDKTEPGKTLRFDCVAGIKEAGRGKKIHYVSWFHKEFERLTGIHVPCLRPKGDYHLTLQERKPIVSGPYWVVIGGGKLDMTAKWWYYARYQEVIDRLAAEDIHCVQAGAHFQRHVHPTLKNCLDATEITREMRDLVSLIANSSGVICGITGPMHIAAIFDKPCVVIAGGREEPWWEAYTQEYNAFGPRCEPVKVPHKFLHTVGQLDCGIGNLHKGCWRSRTVAIEHTDVSTKAGRDKLCVKPLHDGPQPIPLCMSLISTEQVVAAVMSYYEDGYLSRPRLDTTSAAVPLEVPQLLVPTVAAKPTTPPVELRNTARVDPAFELLKHPTIGGKYTIFVLGYGDNPRILRRCLDGIVNTLPASCYDLRVALNQPSPAMRAAAAVFQPSHITKLYVADGDPLDPYSRKKYEAMRQMFWDEACPITTKYLIWFDDDTVPVKQNWAVTLTETILANHRQGARLYGRKLQHDLQMFQKAGNSPLTWFQQASWWRGNHLRLRGMERTAANGSCIDFAVGWFWAMEVAAMRAAQIPDARLRHNGGDIVLGAQIHQAGFKIKAINQNRELVYTPPKDAGGRRGWSEAFPWADTATREKHKPGS